MFYWVLQNIQTNYFSYLCLPLQIIIFVYCVGACENLHIVKIGTQVREQKNAKIHSHADL